MAINHQKTFIGRLASAQIASGYSIENEGMALVGVRENGVMAVRPSAGSSATVTIDGVAVGTEQFAGFSYNLSLRSKSRVEMILATVPTIASGIGVLSLTHVNLASRSVRVVNTSTNAALTVDEVTAAPSSVTAAHVAVDLTKGILYFNVAQSGISILVTYRRVLSAVELAMFVREDAVNADSSAFLNSIQIARGNGDMYTDWFDTTQDYSTATALYAGPNGMVTSVATDGAATPTYYAPIPGAKILQAPTIDDDANLQFGLTLGFTYNVG